MSQLTASGRKTLRDQRRNYLATMLRRHEWFQAAPTQVVSGFADLLLVSRELRATIKAEGVMRADGTVHPAVEAFRKYKHTELGYLTAIAEMRRAEHQEPVDLVAQMARMDATETVETEQAATDPPESDR